MNTCIILGAGGHARETFFSIIGASARGFHNFIFVDDVNHCDSIELDGKRWPIVRDWKFDRFAENGSLPGFVVGVGSPALKATLVAKALEAGLRPVPTVVHERAIVQDSRCEIGMGGVFAAGSVVTTGVRMDDYVTLNALTVVSHDAELGKYVTCCPGVLIAGNVRIEEGVFLGIGSTIRERIRIAPFVIVGAQACVVKDITEARSTVAGVPARPAGPPRQI